MRDDCQGGQKTEERENLQKGTRSRLVHTTDQGCQVSKHFFREIICFVPFSIHLHTMHNKVGSFQMATFAITVLALPVQDANNLLVSSAYKARFAIKNARSREGVINNARKILLLLLLLGPAHGVHSTYVHTHKTNYYNIRRRPCCGVQTNNSCTLASRSRRRANDEGGYL